MRTYGEILSKDFNIQNITTGLLYQDKGKFLLKMFSFFNNDSNLSYLPIELIDVGVDKKTKLPISLNIVGTSFQMYGDFNDDFNNDFLILNY